MTSPNTRSLSVSGELYSRLQAHCTKHRVSMASVVESLMSELSAPVTIARPEPLYEPRRVREGTAEIEISPAVRSLFADQAVRIRASEGRLVTTDSLAEAAINRMLDAFESGAAQLEPTPGICQVCGADAKTLTAGECDRCRTLHPRAGRYDFGSTRSTGVGVHIATNRRGSAGRP